MNPIVEELRGLNLVSVRETGRKIGSGSYGEVFEVRLSGLKCAGKKLHSMFFQESPPDEQRAILSRFAEECLSLSKLRHPNIVQLIGVYFVHVSRVPVMVMEFLPLSLTQCLDRHKPKKIPGYVKTSMLCDVSLGMLFLHDQKPPLIHRDLTANNVLLTSNLSAKIADLGVAKIVNINPAQLAGRMTQCPGTPAYMPPEALSSVPQYDEKLDVFSFGNLILHVCTHQWPLPAPMLAYENNDHDRPIPLNEVQRRQHYLDMMDVQSPLRSLAERCLHNAPQRRPPTATIVSELERFHNLDSTPSFLDMIVENATLREEMGDGVEEVRQELELLKRQRDEEVMRLSLQLSEKEAQITQLLQTQSSNPQPTASGRRSPASTHLSTGPVYQPTGPIHRPPSSTHQPPSPTHRPPSSTHQHPAPTHQPPSHTHQHPAPTHQSTAPIPQPTAPVHHRPTVPIHRPPAPIHQPPNMMSSPQMNYELSGDGQKWAVVGRVASFEIHQNASFPALPVSCLVTTHDGQPALSCRITELSSRWKHRVEYFPRWLCPHYLHLKLGDSTVAGSPFALQIFTAGQLMRTIDGVSGPCGLALTNDGQNLVVVEGIACRVSIFGMDGKRVLSFGSKGSDFGQFLDPRGVAITANDNILIADHANNRIQMFTARGEFLTAIGHPSDKPRTFYQPIGIALHPSGKVFVTEDGGHCVKVFNPNLSFAYRFGCYGSDPGEFLHPTDVAFDSRGMVYIADSHNNRIQKFTPDGNFVALFGSRGSLEGELAKPFSIAIDSKDMIYVAEKANGRLSIFSCEGKFITCFDTFIFHPYGVAVTDDGSGGILVSSHDNDTVSAF